MLNNFLIPATIQAEDKRAEYRLLRAILAILIVSCLMAIIVDGVIGRRPYTIISLAVLSLSMCVFAFFLSKGWDRIVRYAIPASVLIALTFLIWNGDGLHDGFQMALVSVVIIAGLMVSPRAMFLFGVLTALSFVAIGTAEVTGFLVNKFSKLTDIKEILLLTVIVLSISGLESLLVVRLNENFRKVKIISQAQLETNVELIAIQSTLEERVKERTYQLEIASEQIQKRVTGLQAIALVSRSITTIQDIQNLLPLVTTMISKQFKFYHVGIFLLNDKKDFAILRATNSAGGQKMLARGHNLPVGELGIVGNVAASGIARIALNIGEDPIFFNNPDLPSTQSEIALPLKIGGEIIGVLDVQSEQTSAFSEEDINLLTILADQVSIAIHNARSFQNAQNVITQAESISNKYLQQAWQNITSSAKTAGFRYSVAGIKALERAVDTADILHATQSGENVLVDGDNSKKLTVPIKLRGQVMGVINVKILTNRNWNPAEIEITQAIADRVALAIENARLLENSESQAARERTVSEITAKIGASVSIRTVLQTAVEELGRILPGSDVIIQMESKK